MVINAKKQLTIWRLFGIFEKKKKKSDFYSQGDMTLSFKRWHQEYLLFASMMILDKLFGSQNSFSRQKYQFFRFYIYVKRTSKPPSIADR